MLKIFKVNIHGVQHKDHFNQWERESVAEIYAHNKNEAHYLINVRLSWIKSKRRAGSAWLA